MSIYSPLYTRKLSQLPHFFKPKGNYFSFEIIKKLERKLTYFYIVIHDTITQKGDITLLFSFRLTKTIYVFREIDTLSFLLYHFTGDLGTWKDSPESILSESTA
jgi:hypothetical protein